MTSNKPYLLRGIYDWILDNQMVPHIVVDVNNYDVTVPMQYAQDGKIILNISPQAAQNIDLDNDYIAFNARFSGTPMKVYAPMKAVLAIYARETGAGMVFEPDLEDNSPDETSSTLHKPKKPGKPKLTLVK